MLMDDLEKILKLRKSLGKQRDAADDRDGDDELSGDVSSICNFLINL